MSYPKNESKRALPVKRRQKGFTLIELSIVLVIIGLIVGGVLVGQDLIRAAEVRATLSQIEKYNTAVNTFRTKYNALPGDLNQATASAFGFASRGTVPGTGDGNGLIESGYFVTINDGFLQGGETTAFWEDLTIGNPASPLNINLIDGSFNTADVTVQTPTIASSAIASYYPAAKLGRGNSVYVYSTGGINYFGIAAIGSITAGVPSMSAAVTVQQAYQIDKKADDGFPATGNIQALFGDNWAVPNGPALLVNAYASDSATSCYNTSNGATPGAYSIAYNNGSGTNCGLSFRFQ